MSIYKEYRREPSIPHQCMHHREKTGDRCRSRAMHNEVMCFQHRIEDLPTVLQNDPFELTSLYDRAAIQDAVTQIAARLACNHMDLKRAALLLQSCQIAAANLTAHDRAVKANSAAAPLTLPATELDPNPDPEAYQRYQAYLAELGLDEDETPISAPPTAESRSPIAVSENPATEPQPAMDNDQPSTDNVLPTLNAVAAFHASPNTARSAVHSAKHRRKAHAKRRERHEVPSRTARSAYPRTEMPENVITTRPRIGTPNALAGWNTLPSS
jgi:hypothetical protein